MRALLMIIPLLLLGFAAGVSANAECTAESPDCVEVGKWQISVAVGGGVRTNPVLERKDIPLIVLPEVSYTGERFFIQNLDFGFILLENAVHRLNLLATPSYDQVFFHRWSPNNFVVTTSLMAPPTTPVRQEAVTEGPPPTLLGADDSPPPSTLGAEKATPANQRSFNEALLTPPNSVEDVTLGYKIVDLSQLHKRRMAGLAGFEYSVGFNNWDLQAQWVHDVTDIHGGSEVRIAVARHFRWDRHWLAFSLGANWQSDEVIDYYYGVRRNEVPDAESVYVGKAGISSVARMDWRYDLNEHWSLTFTGSYRQLADEISRSPLVEDDEVITGFIGGVYHF